MASGCFRQVNQHGGTSPRRPGVGTGWDLEATLDVSMISVACPRCHILVVEGNSPTSPDLAATERTAARLGAQVISNSYGDLENGFSLPFRKAYQPPGHTVVASSGDFGFTDAQFPADLPTVTAVGGTMLTRAHNRRGWQERVWRQAFGAGGSGCSAWIAKPAWQHDTHCPGRTIADISAVASNIPIFNPVYGGWVTVAGTSASAPLIAGIYGLAGNGTTHDHGPPVPAPAIVLRHHRGRQRVRPAGAGLRRRLPVHREEGLRRAHRPGHPGRARRLVRAAARPGGRRGPPARPG